MWPFKRKKKIYKVRFGDEIHIQIAEDNTKAILRLTEFTVDYRQGTTAIFTDLSRFLERNAL